MSKKLGRPPKETKEHTPRLPIRVSLEQRATWRQAAEAEGLDLSEWVRQVCDKAANRKK